jgi:Leucine-rich repeat (LRR) protein
MHNPFADPRLELAVRAAMPQDVLAQPLSSLTRLDAAELGIRRLRGIEQLSELRWLDLSRNPLAGVMELGANTKLIRLSLAHTGTSTLAGLAGLPDLEDLDLYGSRVVSIDEVAAMPSLRSLDLGLCIVKRLDPLARLTKLESLTLGSPVLHIVRRVMFSTPDPIVVDLAPIEQLHALRQLRLCGLQLSSLARLTELVGLEELVIERCSLGGGGLPALPRFPRLELLSLAQCELDDLTPLTQLPRLRVLQLDEAKFGDLSALAGCETLESLSLREIVLAEYQIETLLRQLPQLTSLRVGNRLIVR